jgi:hypothetical protein
MQHINTTLNKLSDHKPTRCNDYLLSKMENHHIYLRTFLSLTIVFFVSLNSNAQSLGSIEGKILDAKTKESLPGASVYLANTSIGTAANVDGSFLLDKITRGKYDLTVSMLGYKTVSKPMVFNDNSVKNFIIYLNEEAIELNLIEVKAKRVVNNYDLSKFQKYFLGSTQNANRCKIVNGYDLQIINNASWLTASAKKPIEIVNNALGYRVIYVLKEFTLNKTNNMLRMSGVPRFENLVPENDKQQRRWTRERDRAYYGSVEHFIRSLKKRELKKNRFTLTNWDGIEINEQKLLLPNQDSVISYRGKIKVIFSGEFSEVYNKQQKFQESYIDFTGRNVTIYSNGKFEPFEDALLQEYFGWSSGVAELMPLGYQPISRLK